MDDAQVALVAALDRAEVPHEPSERGVVATLPGDRKLKTTVSFVFGRDAVSVNAFVCRAADENFAGVYRFLLRQNQRMPLVAYSLDQLGDIYLTGQIPNTWVNAEIVDQLLGVLLTHADGDFNKLLELGFTSAIEAEWRWRLSRGEPTRNLAAFTHLRPPDDDDSEGEGL